jgi:hypothetical protein
MCHNLITFIIEVIIDAYAIINDVHIPAHSPACLDVTLSVLDMLHSAGVLKEIILNGDIADFFNIKLHPVMPHEFGIKTTIKDEIYLVNKFLDHLQMRYPEATIMFLSGNHEDRLDRYLCKKAPEIFDMMTVPELFKLEDRGIDHMPYGRGQLYQIGETDLFCRHSPYSYSVHCAHACLVKKFINLIFGCTHRFQEMKLKDGTGVEKYACSNASLIDFDNPMFNYMPTDNWANGFSIAFVEKEWWQNQHIKINDKQTVFGGYKFKGSDKFDFT